MTGMGITGVSHVAVRVRGLRRAEEYYCALLSLSVIFRETPGPDGWRTLRGDAAWEEAEAAGTQIGMTMLASGGLVLALEEVGPDHAEIPLGAVDHVGLEMSADDLARFRSAALELRCRLLADRPQVVVIEDAYGLKWEADSTTYGRPEDMSNGVRNGRWLDL